MARKVWPYQDFSVILQFNSEKYEKQILFLLVLLCLTACHSAKNVPDNQLSKIEYGNGGGFTGIVTTNTLTGNGILTVSRQQPREISPAQMDTITSMASKIKTSYIHPSNTYVFLNIYRQNDTVRCSWSSGDNNVDRNVLSLYYKLTKL